MKKIKNYSYKWLATKGVRYQQMRGVGFFTKQEAIDFCEIENDRFDSGYFVVKADDIRKYAHPSETRMAFLK